MNASIRNIAIGILFSFFPSLAGTIPTGASVAPRSILPLNSWHFKQTQATNDFSTPRLNDSEWEVVTLPHTWNVFDGGAGIKDYYRGVGWYRTHFQIPMTFTGKRVLLEFDAANRIADVFVNGHQLGTHIGGFARFRFDATDAVNFQGDNLVAVRVNNATNDFIPRNGDFTFFGGLYRQVRILFTSPMHIATLDRASPGFFLTASNVSASAADVSARVEFANDSAEVFTGNLRVIVNSPDEAEVSSVTTNIEISANGAGEANLQMHIMHPHFWNGVADPFVYQATVELLDDDGQVVDSLTQPLGLRTFEIKPDAGFFLNGQHIQLHGVNRHQEWPDKGWAIGTNEMTEDFGMLQELGANVVRLCHYQHDQFFYDLCDRGGVAVWAECCFVNEPPLTQAGRENALEQMRELIRQNFNHPAIFFWSLGNETSEARDSHAADELLAQLAALVRAEDPSRVSTYASNHGLNDQRNFRSDILAFNKYFGWYGGNFPEFGKFLDDFHVAHPQTSVGVSEYGAGASIYQHEEDPPVRKSQARGPWHPEELQNEFHEEYWQQIKARPWLWGTFVWCLFDFASAGRLEGDTRGRNDKGLVTADRQIRKDAFYWYQANWTSKAMVHIVSKEFCDRVTAQTEIKIYSNAEEVEVSLNDISLGKKSATDCRFLWPGVRLKSGVNRIHTVAYRGGKPVATDSCGWNYFPDGKPEVEAAHP